MCRAFVFAGAGLALVLSACSTPSGSGARAPAPVAAAAPPVVCADFSFPIYFETNSNQLTAPARQVIADSAARVRGCRMGRVDVVGLADADGSARLNMTLSRQRATVVADALAAAGLPRPVFDIDAVGAAGALTPGGRPEPLRRRTEVVIRAAPPPTASAR